MLTYDAAEAVRHLRSRDRELARLIKRVGAFELRGHSYPTPFHALFSAIISQQLSGKAAHSIYQRTRTLFPRGRITVPAVLGARPDALREAGLSRAKIAAVHDLAAKYADGMLPDARRMRALSDDEIVDALTGVRGVGRWTVEMLLIFHLGRPDVLPVGDLGVRKGFRNTYRRRELPTEKQLTAHGERWRPYRSVAAWYMWRAADLEAPRS
ncbi:MAG: DNA-3-methyladenine glycosylase 2 family protein [Gammaproteobacteria bacterium]|nr:DNA-3-methyladenine glycosylase 2 family protein [Gammaproteobacteria bacterium]